MSKGSQAKNLQGTSGQPGCPAPEGAGPTQDPGAGQGTPQESLHPGSAAGRKNGRSGQFFGRFLRGSEADPKFRLKTGPSDLRLDSEFPNKKPLVANFSIVMIHAIVRKVKKFFTDQSGPTAVEYAVLLGLIIIICVVGIRTVGGITAGSFQSSADAISEMSRNGITTEAPAKNSNSEKSKSGR